MKPQCKHQLQTAAFVILTLAAVLVAFPGGAALAKQRQVPRDRVAVQYSYAPIVKRTLPAVVNVYVRYRSKRQRRRNPFLDDPFFRRFFGRSFGVPRERMESSLGSGVVVDPGGLVVTNHHVVEGARNGSIKVALPDKTEYEAKILLADKKTDIAVLKIISDREDFAYLHIGDSDDLQVGDIVLAIGNPFGVGQTVTSGIISALARTGIGKSASQYFIQTDAAINPGNSGGALVDINGDLIGINTAIFSKSGGSLGIGFAIPSNMVKLVLKSAKNGGSVRRPWFGGKVKSVNATIAEGLGLPKKAGVYISSLADESPARKAGLRVGDAILSVNGHEVDDARAFQYHFSIKGIGGSVEFEIWRRGNRFRRKMALVSAPEIPPRRETRLRGANPFSGAVIANLSPALAEEINMNDQRGVVVLRLGRRSYARRIGLSPHDIILEVNGVEVDSVATLTSAVRRSRSYWRFSIKRGQEILTMTIGC